MKLRVSVEIWCTTFAAALGLLPGCGGAVSLPGGSGAGGTGGTGGTGATGGSTGDGPNLAACRNDTPEIIRGVMTGFATCDSAPWKTVCARVQRQPA